jgi:hypothetical protein
MGEPYDPIKRTNLAVPIPTRSDGEQNGFFGRKWSNSQQRVSALH